LSRYRPPEYAPCKLILIWPLTLKVVSESRVGYLCANFSLPGPLCSRLRPDVRDRQTDRHQTHIIANASTIWGRGIISFENTEQSHNKATRLQQLCIFSIITKIGNKEKA